MTKYIVIKGNSRIEFPDLLSAEHFKTINNIDNPILTEEYSISISINTFAIIEKLFSFGRRLKMLFVDDNWNMPMAITLQMSLDLAQKFSGLMALCDSGAIKEIGAILPSIPTDIVFTQERKDKYIELVNQFVTDTYPFMSAS